jgi:hypothetical protein
MFYTDKTRVIGEIAGCQVDRLILYIDGSKKRGEIQVLDSAKEIT